MTHTTKSAATSMANRSPSPIISPHHSCTTLLDVSECPTTTPLSLDAQSAP